MQSYFVLSKIVYKRLSMCASLSTCYFALYMQMKHLYCIRQQKPSTNVLSVVHTCFDKTRKIPIADCVMCGRIEGVAAVSPPQHR